VESPFLLEEVIRFSDCDPAGICYFGTFSTFFDESFIALARGEGIDWDSHLPDQLNFLMPIVQTQTTFYSPLKAGDTARVYTVLTRVGNRSFTSSHLITVMRGDKEERVASGYISRVTVDYTSFKPHAIPGRLREVLDANTMDEDAWQAFLNSH
jgi:acyl-CoA thioesterase FadM